MERIDLKALGRERTFEPSRSQTVGILFSGGPAPAANAVISAASIRLMNNGYRVIGFYKGYEHLMEFDRERPELFVEGQHYLRIKYGNVTKIRQMGGCILKTARANPAKTGDRQISSVKGLADPYLTAGLDRCLDAFEHLQLSALISIGGDDTLKTANLFRLLGMNVVHVPKTIDNDYFGIPWTFGYFSAIERAREDINTYNAEARTTDCYFVVECMGRKAGWYTLGAGIAGEAVRMIGPEEVKGSLDLNELGEDLLNLILEREKHGKPYGVICVSEGLADKLPDDQKPKTKDAYGNIKLADAKIGEQLAEFLTGLYRQRTGRKITIKSGLIGYTTRCITPTAFDVLLGTQLGVGAARFVENHQFGNMVSVGENLEIRPVHFTDLIDGETMKTKVRFVPTDGDFFKLAKELEFRSFSPEANY